MFLSIRSKILSGSFHKRIHRSAPIPPISY
nr:MAG TPA: hypothetical protein [Caudoviricetes sp.]